MRLTLTVLCLLMTMFVLLDARVVSGLFYLVTLFSLNRWMSSLSHRSTLLTKSIVFRRIWNLFHEKCISSSGTLTHDISTFVACPPTIHLCHGGLTAQWKIGLILLDWNWITGLVLLLKSCGFESRCSHFFIWTFNLGRTLVPRLA